MSYIVRHVLPTEYAKYCTHLKNLDAQSKVLRFGYPIADTMIDRVCSGIEKDWQNHILFCIEDDDLEFLAVSHIALGDRMELAFSVLNQYQGQGMGSLLMKRCIQYCRAHNILSGYMMCLSHNRAIKHLCAKHGIIMHSEHGETTADIELASPGIDTYIQESIDTGISAFDYLSKRSWLSWKKLLISSC